MSPTDGCRRTVVVAVVEQVVEPVDRVTVTGDWRASWQTFRSGEEKIATQPIHMRQEGDLVHIAATRRGLSAPEGGYLWTGELRFWDNEVLTGWYAANDGSIRSKGHDVPGDAPARDPHVRPLGRPRL